MGRDDGRGGYSVGIFGTRPLAGNGAFLEVVLETSEGIDRTMPFRVDVEANEGLVTVEQDLRLLPVLRPVRADQATD